MATRRVLHAPGVDPRLLLRLSRQPLFVVALGLNLVGFSLHVLALQSLPLFLVQATIASSVAVTAVLSVLVLSAPLTRRQAVAVLAVVAGLAILAPTAADGSAEPPGAAAPLVLLAVVLATGVAAVERRASAAGAGRAVAGTARRRRVRRRGGGRPAAARPDARRVLGSPVAYVLALAGLVAFLLYATAMQRGSVTTSTAAMVVTQTSVPAVVGALLLGDRVQDGLGLLAAAGFALAVAGALGLTRYEAGLPVIPPPESRAYGLPAPGSDDGSP